MKIYGTINKEGFLEIACPSPIEGGEEIEITNEEREKIQFQFDTKIVSGKIKEQKKGENALKFEEILEKREQEKIEAQKEAESLEKEEEIIIKK